MHGSGVHQLEHFAHGGGVLARHREPRAFARERDAVRRCLRRVRAVLRRGDDRRDPVRVHEELAHRKRERAERVGAQRGDVRLERFPTSTSVPSSTMATACTLERSIS